MTRTHPDAIELIQRDARLLDFIRLIFLFTGQAEMKPYIGSMAHLCASALAVPLYLRLVIRKWRPMIIFVQYQGQMIGGITLSRFDILENAALTDAPSLKRRALRVLIPKLLSLLTEPGAEPIRARTLNPTLIKVMSRLGFVDTNDERYIVTLLLGPFTWSWISKTRPRRLLPLMRVSVLKSFMLPASKAASEPINQGNLVETSSIGRKEEDRR